MIFTALNNPDIKSLTELVVFSYNERRVLVPLPATYEDAVSTVRKEFSLDYDGEIRFTTEELQGCLLGLSVEIRRDAWVGISHVPAKISVTVTPTSTSASVPSSLSKGKAPVKPTPSAAPTTARLSFQSKRAPRVSLPKVSSQVSTSRPSIVARTSMLKPQTPTSSAPSRNSVATSSSSVFPVAKRLAAAAVAAPSPAVPAEEPEEDELYDDDDNDEVFSNPSPSKSSANRSARQRIMSEPEDEDEDGDEEADEDEDSEGYDRVQREDLRDHENEAEEAAVEAEVASGLVMSQGSTAPNLAERLFEDVVPMEERVSVARPRVAEPEASTSTPAAPARTPGKQSKAKMLAKLEPLESIEKNFLITVEYDDGGEEVHNSTFKTKGRHIVGKVLLTALRTFGIEDAIDRSSLVLIREDVVGGKAVRRTYPCSLDETMANAGARPNARLAILIDEDEEDDE